MIKGFLNILFKILEEEQPQYLMVAFDVHAPTFRHEMFDAYKGTRKPMADELRQQVPVMKDMLRAMGVTVIEKEGYEADDILGTIADMLIEASHRTQLIVTTHSDALISTLPPESVLICERDDEGSHLHRQAANRFPGAG